MTKIMSAHSICSDDSSVLAPRLRPAESVSTPGHVENTCSAVGLRSWFALQTKRTLVMKFVLPTGPLGGSVDYNVPNPTHDGIERVGMLSFFLVSGTVIAAAFAAWSS